MAHPTIVSRIAQDVLAAAKAWGVHGKVRIRKTAEAYEITVVIPLAETVPARR